MSTRNRNARAARPAASAPSAPLRTSDTPQIPTLAAAPSSTYKDAEPIESAKRAAEQKAQARAQADRALRESADAEAVALFGHVDVLGSPLGGFPAEVRSSAPPLVPTKRELNPSQVDAQHAPKPAPAQPAHAQPHHAQPHSTTAPKRTEFGEALLHDARERTRANNIIASSLSQDLPPDAMRAVVESRLKGQALEIGRELTRDAVDKVDVLVRLQESRKVAGALETAANKSSTPDAARALTHEKLDSAAAHRADEAIDRAVAAVARAQKPEFSDARFEAQRTREAETKTAKPEFSDARFEAQRAREAEAAAATAAGVAKPEFSDVRFEARRAREEQAAAAATSTVSKAPHEVVRPAADVAALKAASAQEKLAASLVDTIGLSRDDAHKMAASLTEKASRQQQHQMALADNVAQTSGVSKESASSMVAALAQQTQGQRAAQETLAASVASSTGVSRDDAMKTVKDMANQAGQQVKAQEALAKAVAPATGASRDDAARQVAEAVSQSTRQQAAQEALASSVASATGMSRSDATKLVGEAVATSAAQQAAQSKVVEALRAQGLTTEAAQKMVGDLAAGHQQTRAQQDSMARHVAAGAETSLSQATKQEGSVATGASRLQAQQESLSKAVAQTSGLSSEAAARVVENASGVSPSQQAARAQLASSLASSTGMSRDEATKLVADVSTNVQKQQSAQESLARSVQAETGISRAAADKLVAQAAESVSKSPVPAAAASVHAEGDKARKDAAPAAPKQPEPHKPAAELPTASTSPSQAPKGSSTVETGSPKAAAQVPQPVPGKTVAAPTAEHAGAKPAVAVPLEQALAQHMKQHGFDNASIGMVGEVAAAVREEVQGRTGNDTLVLHKSGDALATFTSQDKVGQLGKGDTVLSIESLARVAERGTDTKVVEQVRDFAPEATRGLSDLQVGQAFSGPFLDRAQKEGFPADLAKTLQAGVKEDFRAAGAAMDNATSKTMALEHLDESWGQGKSVAQTVAHSESRTQAALDAAGHGKPTDLHSQLHAHSAQVQQQTREAHADMSRQQAQAGAEMTMH